MNKLNYILNFPLVKNDKFTLYHIYSIPIRHYDSSLYSTILPEQPFLATSSTRQQYATLESLKNCKTFAEKKMVCKNLPIYNQNTRPICEMSILLSTDSELPKICEKTTFSAQINTFQAIDDNKWIYILHHKTTGVLQCIDKSTHYELQGNGIIALPEHCKFYTAFATLAALDSTTTNISHPIITVDIQEDCEEKFEEITPPELVHIKLNNVPLESLNSMKEELREYSRKLENDRKSTFIQKHSGKLSLFAYIMGIMMLIFMIYKCCCCHPLASLCKRIFQSDDHNGCIQIFNNCFGNTTRRNRNVVIPLSEITQTTSCISEDEDEPSCPKASTSKSFQSSGHKARSLF